MRESESDGEDTGGELERDDAEQPDAAAPDARPPGGAPLGGPPPFATSIAGLSLLSPGPDRHVAGAVRLDPVLSSVAHARALVTDVGSRSGLDRSATDDAALVVSELVTNAVLHARTHLDVAVRVDGATIRVEVSDTSDDPVLPPESASAPAPMTDVFDDLVGGAGAILDALSTTGRGMELVGALSRQWGVSPRPDGGKTVWAELGAGPPVVDRRSQVTPAAPPPSPGASVRLVAVPLRLIHESDHQFDDSLRELQVMAMSEVSDPEVASLAALAEEVLDLLRPVRLSGQQAVRAAWDRGDRLVDLRLEIPADVEDVLERIGLLLSEMGQARHAGHLLVLPPSAEVVAFRLWYREEVLRQMAGERLRPCPFPVVADERQDHSRHGPLSERRQNLLRRLRDDLAAATDRATLASAAVRRVAADVGAAFVNLLFVTADGTHVDLADRIGYPPHETRGKRYPVTHDNPISEAVRTAWPIVLRTREERLDRYPDLPVSAPLESNPTGVWIPLGSTAPALGALVVGFSRSRDFTDTDLHFLLQVGVLIGDRLGQLPR